MQLTLKPTDEVKRIDGFDHRIWKGTDEHGTPVHAMIRCVSPQTENRDRLCHFEAALNALPPLKQTGVVYDHRFFTD